MKKLKIRELAIFGILGGMMYASKALMSALPNIHLIAVFIGAETLTYRKKALYPIAIYVLFEGLFGGFTVWWLPYLFVWPLLWGAFMILPKNMPKKYAIPVYMLTAGLHGLLYGTLTAPFYAIPMGLDMQGMKDWIIMGLPYDAIHGISNFCLGTLIYPIAQLLKKLEKGTVK